MESLNFILLVLVSFFSSVIGTMVGMAMLIILPVMLFVGIPVHSAIATSRFSMLGINIGNMSNIKLKERIISS